MKKTMVKKKKFVLFTGAGASKAFEFPLTSEFLPEIRRRLKEKVLFGSGKRAELLHKRLRIFFKNIYPGFNEIADGDLPLITDVLSLLDHSLATANSICLGTPRRELSSVRRLLEHAIYLALDWEIDFESQPKLLYQFVDSISKMSQKSQIGIISTNYDPLIEMTIFEKLSYKNIVKLVDFGCEWRDDVSGKIHNRPANPSIAVYKLHGSLNMLKCPHCEHVYINLDGATSYLDYQGNGRAREDGWNQCHCEYAPLEACMVAPTSIRDIRDSNLTEIWRNALEFLRTADNWFIVGYSFPPEDLGIRSLFCRAFQARQKKPRVFVIQHGFDQKTIARYQIMFPNCFYEHNGMEVFAKKFGNDLDYLRNLPTIKEVASKYKITV